MPVCGNYLFFELPKKIVLNPKDGSARNRSARFPATSTLGRTYPLTTSGGWWI